MNSICATRMRRTCHVGPTILGILGGLETDTRALRSFRDEGTIGANDVEASEHGERPRWRARSRATSEVARDPLLRTRMGAPQGVRTK